MSTKASTAALDPIGQRFLLPRRSVPRHPASGQKLQEGNRCGARVWAGRETTMKTSTEVPSDARIKRAARNFYRRIIAASLLAACVLVAPAIASVTHAPLNPVRLPRIHPRAIENLQRWANDEEESWCEDS